MATLSHLPNSLDISSSRKAYFFVSLYGIALFLNVLAVLNSVRKNMNSFAKVKSGRPRDSLIPSV